MVLIPSFSANQKLILLPHNADEATVLHLHGSYTRAVWDGWAEDLIYPREYKDYYFPNSNTARTLWYHGAYLIRFLRGIMMILI